MKKVLFLLVLVIMFGSCEIPTGGGNGSLGGGDPSSPFSDGDPNDPRLFSFGDATAKWLRAPFLGARGIVHNVFSDGHLVSDDPMAQYCTDVGWVYMFYDDGAVIGYDPMEEAVANLHYLARLTVEARSLSRPDAQWGLIIVPFPPTPGPDRSNDPILEKWQLAFALETGEIVFLHQAENLQEFRSFKTDTLVGLTLEAWNSGNGPPNAHIVWGPEEDPPPLEEEEEEE